MSERVAGREEGFSGFVPVKRHGDTEIRVKFDSSMCCKMSSAPLQCQHSAIKKESASVNR